MSNLDQSLRLEEVSRAVDLSPFHFHRVFQSVVGMTLAEFVKRRRLDKALQLMAYANNLSLTRVALEAGFASSSDFSRCFKQQYFVAPSAFDIEAWQAEHRKELAATISTSPGQFHIQASPLLSNLNEFKVFVRDLPARTVAYVRVSNPYQGDAVWHAAERLIEWADRRQLAGGKWLGYQWENPQITPLKDCQYYVAVESPQWFEATDEVGRFEFPRMTVAEVEVRGTIELELQAFQWLYAGWLPSSGYVPDDWPCIEAWMGKPYAHGKDHFELYAQMPVKRC